jgi:hypothetical protein
MAVAALAPIIRVLGPLAASYLLENLFTSGLPDTAFTDASGKIRPGGLDPATVQAEYNKAVAAAGRKKLKPGTDAFNEFVRGKMSSFLGKVDDPTSILGRAASAYKTPPGKIRSGLGKAGSIGMKGLGGLGAVAFGLSSVPMLMSMFAGDGEGGGMAQGMGGPPTGEGGDLMELLGSLSEAGASPEELRGDYLQSEAAVRGLDRASLARGRVDYSGVAPGLETLIRGYEDELGRISYQEPMSLAQAYALKGIFDPSQSDLSMRDIMGGM